MTQVRPKDSLWPLFILAVGYLYFFPYFSAVHNPNENVRVYMTLAIVEHGTYAINEVEKAHGYVNDKAARDGKLYSCKAPGPSLLGVPVALIHHQIAQALWGPGRPELKTTILILRLFCSALPSLLFLILFRRALRRFVDRPFVRDMATIILGLGTIFYSSGLIFVGHQIGTIGAAAAFLALMASRDREGHTGLIAAAGFLAAWSVISEYSQIITFSLLFLYALLTTPRAYRALAYGVGALPPALLGAHFHHSAFGSVFKTGYEFLENPAFQANVTQGFLGLTAPSLESLRGLLITPATGLFFFCPILMMAIPGFVLWLVFRGGSIDPSGGPRHPRRLELLVCAGVTLAIIAFVSSMSAWRGGWSVGPRYISPVVPFMMFGAALWADRLGALGRGAGDLFFAILGVASLIVTAIPSIVFPHLPEDYFSKTRVVEAVNPAFEVGLALFRRGLAPHSLGTWLGLEGWHSALPAYLVLGAAAMILLAGSRQTAQASKATSLASILMTRAATGILVLTLALSAMGTIRAPQQDVLAGTISWIESIWEPKEARPPAPPPLPSLDVLELRLRQKGPSADLFLQMGQSAAEAGDAEQAIRYFRLASGLRATHKPPSP